MLPEIKNIIFLADYNEPSETAFQYAMVLAQAHQTRIHIVCAVNPLTPIAHSVADFYLNTEDRKHIKAERLEVGLEEIRKALHVFCDNQTCHAPEGDDLVADISVIGGDDIAQIVLKQAKKVGANLIVMGATEDMKFSKSTQQIFKQSRIPVLYIPYGDA